MSLGHRLVVPPHSGGGGALLGTEDLGGQLAVAALARMNQHRRWALDGADTIVLACGSVSDDTLYHALAKQHPAACRSPPARPATWSAPR